MSEAVLAAIASPGRPRIRERLAVIVAHPDDETLGCGALLPRLDDVRIVHITDGAPRNGEDARRHGFPDAQAYAASRQRELEAAVALAGIGPERLSSLGVPDQGAAHDLAAIARRLVPVLSAADVVLTHAAEGGHPDHDAVAFAVAAAADLVGADAPIVIEMPFYRAGADGEAWLRQSFADPDGAVTLRLTPSERARKAAMLAAHASQAGTLSSFGSADEPYRVATPFHVATARRCGPVLYDRFDWGVTSARFQDLAVEARRELGLLPAGGSEPACR